MAKLVVVENDKVEGTDKHNVQGNATSPSGTVPYAGVADFDYVGKMTGQLSEFVKIDGTPVATVRSNSSLNPGETAPGGGHSGFSGRNFQPPTPTPIAASLSIPDAIGEGSPSATAGSQFARIDGDPILLDGDSIDTCDGLGIPRNSTVTVERQTFVSCSE